MAEFRDDGPYADENEFDLRAVFGVLQRQARLMLVTVLVVMGLAGLVIFSLKPVYTASALVLVDTSQKNLLDPSADVLGSSSDNARVESEVELAKSETVLLRVVKDAGLLEDPEFAPRPGVTDTVLSLLRIRDYAPPTGADLLEATLRHLREAVSVQRRGLTFLIGVQARFGDPVEAARIANILAKTYIAEQLEAKIDSTLASRDIIQGRIADASAAVATSDNAIDDFIGTNISAISDETGKADLESLYQQVLVESQRRQQLSSLVDQASSQLTTRDWPALISELQSDAMRQLESQREKRQSALAAAAPGSPEAVNLKAELDKIEADLDQAAQGEIGGLRTQVANSQGRVTDLKSQLRSDVLAANLSSSTLTHIYELQQSAEIARNQYQTLLTRLKDLDQQAYLQVADSRIASEALPPDEPSFPNPKLLFAIAAIAALVIAVVLAFIYENFIGGVVSTSQLQALIGVPKVVLVPRQKEPRNALSLADMLVRSPLSIFSESVRKVRVAMDQATMRAGSANQDRRGAVVLVTSAASNEGKTTMALSLARAYSLSGKAVLLIDCDLRKPSLHRQVGTEPSNGLIDYLGATENPPQLKSIISVDSASGAALLTGSRNSVNATDQLVAGATFSQLIDAATRAFDVVVLDTPPVGPVVDGLYLAQFADAVAFIVRWANTTQPEVKAAVASIRDSLRPTAEIVAVLNQGPLSRSSYSGRYAHYYSEA